MSTNETELADALDLLAAGVEALAAIDPAGLPPELLEVGVLAVGTLAEQVHAQQVRLLSELTERDAQPDETVGWLARVSRCGSGSARRAVLIAARLPQLPLVAAAFAAGTVGYAQVNHLCRAATLERMAAAQADQAALLAAAQRMTPGGLAAWLDGWKLRVDPVGSDDEHADLRAQRHLWLSSPDPDTGSVTLGGTLDPDSAAVVRAALAAAVRDQRHPHDDRDPEQRTADALTEIHRFYLAHAHLPQIGGRTPGVVVVYPADGDTAPHLLGGGTITPAMAEQYVCAAWVTRLTMTADRHVTDMGRAVRDATGAQRLALAVRDGGCRGDGCRLEHRPDRCHPHHIAEWDAHNGPTDLHNLVLLCWRHHTLLHHHRWRLRHEPDGWHLGPPPRRRSPGIGPEDAGGVADSHEPPLVRAEPAVGAAGDAPSTRPPPDRLRPRMPASPERASPRPDRPPSRADAARPGLSDRERLAPRVAR